MAKKIAIPTREGMIDDHFGHCAYYTVFTLDEQNQVMNQERLDSPEESCDHHDCNNHEEKPVYVIPSFK